jgi:hypothetical protein
MLDFFEIKKMKFFKKMGKELSKQRTIDISVEKTLKSMKSGFKVMPSREIQAWKAYLVVTFAAGFAAALIWGAYISIYPISTASETQQVTLTANSAVASHSSGEEFPVELLLDTAEKNIVAVQAIFTYDKNVLELKSIDTSGSSFIYEVKNTIDAGAGQGFVSMAKSTPGVNSQSAKVAVANFRALADTAEPTLQLKFDTLGAVTDSAAILDDGQGTNVLGKVLNKASVAASVAANSAESSIGFLVGLSDTLAKISWSEGSLTSSNYVVERKTGKAFFSKIAEVGSDVRSFIDRSVKSSKLYSYRICQLNEAGAKSCTPEKQVKTPAKKKIFKPRLTAGIQDGKINLTWSPIYTTDFNVVIQRKSGNTKKFTTLSVISSDTQNSYLDETVVPGTKYAYRMIVKSRKKNSQTTKQVNIVAPKI